MCCLANDPWNSHFIKSPVNLRRCCVAPPAGKAARPAFSAKRCSRAFFFPAAFFVALPQTGLKKLLWVQQFKVSLINNTGKSAETRRGAQMKRSEENGFSLHHWRTVSLALFLSFWSCEIFFLMFFKTTRPQDLWIVGPCKVSSS